jgi:hypothetical protein
LEEVVGDLKTLKLVVDVYSGPVVAGPKMKKMEPAE